MPVVTGTRVDEQNIAHDIITMTKVSRNVYATSTSRFLSHLVCVPFLDYVSTLWKLFGEFFGLLLAVAKIGRAQRFLLAQLQTPELLFDLYLGPQSPMFEPGKRQREVMGNKNSKADFTQLLDVVSLLVRGFVK